MCYSSGIVAWIVNCICCKCFLLLLVYFIARGLEKYNGKIVRICILIKILCSEFDVTYLEVVHPRCV